MLKYVFLFLLLNNLYYLCTIILKIYNMAFYNEFFIEKNGELIHLGSCCGSDTPSYFWNVKNISDWNEAISKVTKENGFHPHNNERHPFPWETYKTSDWLIVLSENNKKWFQFWKPNNIVLISVEKYKITDKNKCYFIPINKFFGDVVYIDENNDITYNSNDLFVLDLPKLKKN